MKKIGKSNHIVIIGAGPAGAVLAYLLSQTQQKITIIDKNTKVNRKVCGEYLCPSGVTLFKELGLDSEILKDFNKLWGMKLVSPDQTQLTSFFPQDSNIKPYGLSINRQQFDQSLRDLIVPRKNINTCFGESFLDIKRDGNYWMVKTSKQNIKADLVVGADGINSLLAKKLKHRKLTNSKRIALHCYLKTKKPTQYSRVGQMHILGDGSYCGLNPINQDQINFSIVCDAHLLTTKKPYQILNHYIENSKALNEMFHLLSESTQVNSLCPITLENKVIASDGIAYIGDAAGFIDPLTGEGMFNALLSAKLLADNIIKYPKLNSALDHYKQDKKKIHRAKTLLNQGFQYVIKSPRLSNFIAKFIKVNQNRANAFIGIIGNIYSPFEGLLKMFFPSKNQRNKIWRL